MLELELNNAGAQLVSFDPKYDKKDDKPFAELSISVAATSDVLAFFEPTLKHMTFDENGPRDLADGLPLRDKHMVYPLKRDEEMHNAEVVIDYGVSDKIKLASCQLKGFQLTPREGGAVIVDFVVRCRPDAYKDVPHLFLLQSRGINITLVPCPREDLPEMKEAA
jgi:hypothetical protein